MVYTDDADGRADDRVRRRRRGRAAAAQPHRRRGRGAGPARADHRGALRPADGHRVGQGRPRRRALRPAGAARDGEVAASAGTSCSGSGSTSTRRRSLVEGRAIGQKIGAGAVRVLTSIDADARVHRGRGAGRRHDRPRLGADHEARLGDRHQPRRPHLPRRDHRPRARHPRRGRHRRRHQGRWRTAARSPSRAPRATPGYVYDGLLDFTVEETELDEMPDIAGQDHDERRHARSRRSRSRGCPTRASAWPGWSSSSTGRSASTPRRCSTSTTSTPSRCATRSPSRSRRTPARGSSSCSASPRASRCSRPRSRPNPVIVRMSDFKSNEYANLVGGELLRAGRGEPDDRLPRRLAVPLARSSPTASRWSARRCSYVRDEMGLTNVKIMIPFVRTVAEAEGVIDLLAEHGLVRGENDLQVVMMCEVPVQRRHRRRSSSSTSTASRSAPTT